MMATTTVVQRRMKNTSPRSIIFLLVNPKYEQTFSRSGVVIMGGYCGP